MIQNEEELSDSLEKEGIPRQYHGIVMEIMRGLVMVAIKSGFWTGVGFTSIFFGLLFLIIEVMK